MDNTAGEFFDRKEVFENIDDTDHQFLAILCQGLVHRLGKNDEKRRKD